MKKFLVTLVAGIFLLGMTTTASATELLYTASTGGPTTYTLNFTLNNNTLPNSIQWLSVYFGQTPPAPDPDHGLVFTQTQSFSNLVPDFNGNFAPPGWFSYSLEPTAIDNPGVFNSDATGAGLAPLGSLSGFTVTFDMQQGATFRDLYFLVGDLVQVGQDLTYNILDSGSTVYSQPSGVPEPSTVLLLGAGLAGLAYFKRKKC